MGRRNTLITWFVIGWTLLFQYETLRANYLSPLLGRQLPKMALLFPPAGWIMFFRVPPEYGFAEVHGIRDGQPTVLDPHRIFETTAVGYDNIRRNVLVGVLSPGEARRFCRYLRRKFPAYDSFLLLYGRYPDLVNAPERVEYQPLYQCAASNRTPAP